FNEVLAHSLAGVETRDRVVIDTGDGAAIAFLDDPERALFAALAIFDNVGELPVRMGINLGPVYLAKDINGQDNVIGDGINVAQRVMSFAQKRELLVSRYCSPGTTRACSSRAARRPTSTIARTSSMR